MAKEQTGPNYPLVFGVVVGVFFVGAALTERSRRKRARGEITRKPKRPALIYDLRLEDLRAGDYVADLGTGDAMRVRLRANASAGIFWKGAVTEVGPEGSPVALKSTTTSVEEGGPLPATYQDFQVTGVRPGTATVIFTATDPHDQVVDSVTVFIEVL